MQVKREEAAPAKGCGVQLQSPCLRMTAAGVQCPGSGCTALAAAPPLAAAAAECLPAHASHYNGSAACTVEFPDHRAKPFPLFI